MIQVYIFYGIKEIPLIPIFFKFFFIRKLFLSRTFLASMKIWFFSLELLICGCIN